MADPEELLRENEFLRARVEELELSSSLRSSPLSSQPNSLHASGLSLCPSRAWSTDAGGRNRREIVTRPTFCQRVLSCVEEAKRTREEEQQLMETYESFSEPIYEAWKASSVDTSERWTDDMFRPFARRLRGAPVPKLKFEALRSVFDKYEMPLIVDLEAGTEERYGSWGDENPLSPRVEDMEIAWVNGAATSTFGMTVEGYKEWERRAEPTTTKFFRQTEQAILKAVFEDGDTSPFREVFFSYGDIDDEDDWNPAEAFIMQITPALLEMDGKIHFAYVQEPHAPLKYPREITDRMLMPLAVFRYTEVIVVIFSMEGVILQQNAASMAHFGMVAASSTTYQDVGEGGKPVNRLRRLFGGDAIKYKMMMEKVEGGTMFQSHVRVRKSDMCPEGRNGQGSNRTRELEMEDHIDFMFMATKMRDPCSGGSVIYCDLQDISVQVRQEQKIKAMRENEQGLLREMLPSHIIDRLVKDRHERRSSSLGNSSRSSSRSLRSSDGGLLLDGAMDLSSDRVASLAEFHKQVTVFFCDIVGFTRISACSTPRDVMGMLNKLFVLLDEATEEHGIFKVETIGDAYMCVAGLNMKDGRSLADPGHHASNMVKFCRDALLAAGQVTDPHGHPVKIRIGLHSGDVMTGVVGCKMPRFCLFGDTVNTASRMESTGIPMRVHASKATKDLLPGERWEPTGGVEAKGKGKMDTFLLL